MRSIKNTAYSRILTLLLCICIMLTTTGILNYSNASSSPLGVYPRGSIVDNKILLLAVTGSDGGIVAEYWEENKATFREEVSGNEKTLTLNYSIFDKYGVVSYGGTSDIQALNPDPSDFMPVHTGYFTKNGQKGEYKYLGYTKTGGIITNDRWFVDASRFGATLSDDYRHLTQANGTYVDIYSWKENIGAVGADNDGWYNFDNNCVKQNHFIITPKVRRLLTTNFSDSDHPSAKTNVFDKGTGVLSSQQATSYTFCTTPLPTPVSLSICLINLPD